jgi:hypothetical protein
MEEDFILSTVCFFLRVPCAIILTAFDDLGLQKERVENEWDGRRKWIGVVTFVQDIRSATLFLECVNSSSSNKSSFSES